MSLQWDLSRLFHNEESGAGEAASGGGTTDNSSTESAATETSSAEESVSESPSGVNHDENLAALAEWQAEQQTATITTDEPVKPNPVSATNTDAVSNDDAAALNGNGQDELLLSMAEAYDFTREELEGISNAGLRNLITREQRREALANPPAETVDDTVNTQTTADGTGTQQTVVFDQYAQAIRDNMAMQGHDEETIERQVQIEKLKWDREELLVNDARQAREETQWVRQQFEQERRQQFEANERQGFFDIVARAAGMEKGLLPMPGDQNAPPDQVANLNKWWTAFNDVKRVRRDVQELSKTNLPAARAKAANIAFSIAFPEVVARRGQIAYSNKVLKQSRNVMGSVASAKPSSTTTWTGPLDESPAVNRAFEKMQRNRT